MGETVTVTPDDDDGGSPWRTPPPPTSRTLARLKPLAEHDPAQIGGYWVEGLLGRGGMGSVYLARTSSGRPVAVKVIHADLAAEPQFVRLFHREAQLVRGVARFCTADVIDVGTADGRPYLVTEFIDGPTVTEEIHRRGPFQPPRLERLAIAVSTALTAIHAAGTIHRDLKPSNVLLSADGPLVIDFGIAVALDSTASPGQPGVGTPGYMAPEQARGDRVGPAADIFAWGGVVVFAATGRPPFGTGPTPALLYRVVHERPDLSGVPEPLRAVVAQAMDPDPARRPTATQLYSLLVPTVAPAAGVVRRVPSDEARGQAVRPRGGYISMLTNDGQAEPAGGSGPPGQVAAPAIKAPSTPTPRSTPWRQPGDQSDGGGMSPEGAPTAGDSGPVRPRRYGPDGERVTGGQPPRVADWKVTADRRRPVNDQEPVLRPSAGGGGAGPRAGDDDQPDDGQPGGSGGVRRPGLRAGRGLARRRPRQGTRLRQPRRLAAGALVVLTAAVATILLLTSTGGRPDGASTSADKSGGPATHPPASATSTARPTPSQLSPKDWEKVLVDLDAARGRAFEQVDESLLADVYQVGSAVYSADRALLRQVASGGFHVSGLSLRVLDLQIRELSEDRAVLRVTDQQDAYAILDATDEVVQRHDQGAPEHHEVTLARTAGGWRISNRTAVA